MGIKKDILSGIALFLSISYLFIVLPNIYADAGLDIEKATIAVALVIAISTIIASFLTKLPIVIAPGIALSSFAVYTLVKQKGISWETILVAVFIEGFIFFALSISKLREWFAEGIPNSMKYGILAGVGIYLMKIGLEKSGMISFSGLSSIALHSPVAIVSLVGLIAGSLMLIKKVPGGFFFTILIGYILSLLLGLASVPEVSVVFPRIGEVFHPINFSLLSGSGFIGIIIALFMVDFFDTLGSGASLLIKAGKMSKKGKLIGLDKIMISDSIATMLSPIFGTTTCVVSLESVISIHEKVNPYIPAIIVALLSLLTIFIPNIAKAFPGFVVSPVLILIGLLFFTSIKMENFERGSEAIPAVLTTILIPLTSSISDGIGLGSIMYVLLKILLGKYKEISPAMLIVSLIFLIDYLYLF